MEEFYHPKTVWVPLGILLGSGTLFAVLTLQWQCCFVTLSTATFGSAIITVTVDYFIEMFALVHYIYERLKVWSRGRLRPSERKCLFLWYVWKGSISKVNDPVWKIVRWRHSSWFAISVKERERQTDCRREWQIKKTSIDSLTEKPTAAVILDDYDTLYGLN